jgi:hypothetical protein
MSLLATLERQREELEREKESATKRLDWLTNKIEGVEADINEVKEFESGDGEERSTPTVSTARQTRAVPASKESGGGGNKRAKNDIPLKALVLQILKKHRSGLALKEIVVKCREAGYKSSVDDKNPERFSQIVYQQLHKLMNPPKGTKAQVARSDKDKSKYQLVAA